MQAGRCTPVLKTAAAKLTERKDVPRTITVGKVSTVHTHTHTELSLGLRKLSTPGLMETLLLSQGFLESPDGLLNPNP